MCPELVSLDVEDNLFHSWSQVAHLVKQTPKLTCLRLGKNYLQPDTLLDRSDTWLRPPSASVIPALSSGFQNLTVLLLNEIPHALQCVLSLAKTGCFKKLEELHLCDNSIGKAVEVAGESADEKTTISPLAGAAKALSGSDIAEGFPSLRTLNLANNTIDDWDLVNSCFSELPSVSKLIINQNELKCLSYAGGWTSLQMLCIDDTKFATCTSFEDISKFPQLTQLRFRRTPLYEALGEAACRSMIVGRFGCLKTLNLSNIGSRERSDSEKGWMQQCHALLSKPKEDVNGLVCEPRLKELVKIHGEPAAPIKEPQSLAKRLLELEIVMVGENAKAPVSKKLPPQTKITAMKGLCKKLFKLRKPPNAIKLQYRHPQDGFVIDLDKAARSLTDCAVESGGQILVSI